MIHDPITDREKDTLVAVLEFFDRMGRWPTFAELDRWMGIDRDDPAAGTFARGGRDAMWRLRGRGLAGWAEGHGFPHGLTRRGALYASELVVERSSSV